MSYMPKQQTRRTRRFPGIELNDQSFEITEKFCYLGDMIGARGCAVDSALTRIRSGLSKFRDLVSLLASGGLPLRSRLCSACVPNSNSSKSDLAS